MSFLREYSIFLDCAICETALLKIDLNGRGTYDQILDTDTFLRICDRLQVFSEAFIKETDEQGETKMSRVDRIEGYLRVDRKLASETALAREVAYRVVVYKSRQEDKSDGLQRNSSVISSYSYPGHFPSRYSLINPA